MAQVPVVTVKVEAFRGFIQTVFAQVAEQMCSEFEREVAMLTDDVATYRTELARCGELLAVQLGREKQLHGMLESIAGNSGTLVANAEDIGKSHAQLTDHKSQMHDMVEMMFGKSTHALNSTFQGVNEAHSINHTHLAQAKELQNQALTAENELNRIMSLLTQAPVSTGPVGPINVRAPTYQVGAPQYPQLGSVAAPQTAPILSPSAAYGRINGLSNPGTPQNMMSGPLGPLNTSLGGSPRMMGRGGVVQSPTGRSNGLNGSVPNVAALPVTFGNGGQSYA